MFEMQCICYVEENQKAKKGNTVKKMCCLLGCISDVLSGK